MSPESCSGCRHFKEHVASLFPFKVIESAVGKPLRIGGVALASGMSRNFNVYTPEELAVFAEKLVNAPVYIEHVTVENAAGKVTKCTYDAASRCLLYEAEIYDQTIADKVRNGLIQHVSVGADYEKFDVVDAKVPHGLFNPELSLVAVPGRKTRLYAPFCKEHLDKASEYANPIFENPAAAELFRKMFPVTYLQDVKGKPILFFGRQLPNLS